MTEAEQIKALEARVAELEAIIKGAPEAFRKASIKPASTSTLNLPRNKTYRPKRKYMQVDPAFHSGIADKYYDDLIAPPGVTITKVEGALLRHVKEYPIQVKDLPLP